MPEITFEWDEKKNKQNQKWHGINFEDAKFVFNDPFRLFYLIYIIAKKKNGGLLLGL